MKSDSVTAIKNYTNRIVANISEKPIPTHGPEGKVFSPPVRKNMLTIKNAQIEVLNVILSFIDKIEEDTHHWPS